MQTQHPLLLRLNHTRIRPCPHAASLPVAFHGEGHRVIISPRVGLGRLRRSTDLHQKPKLLLASRGSRVPRKTARRKKSVNMTWDCAWQRTQGIVRGWSGLHAPRRTDVLRFWASRADAPGLGAIESETTPNGRSRTGFTGERHRPVRSCPIHFPRVPGTHPSHERIVGHVVHSSSLGPYSNFRRGVMTARRRWERNSHAFGQTALRTPPFARR